MIKETETHRYAEYVDNHLDLLLPGAIAVWQQHHNLLKKSFRSSLTDEEVQRLNQLGDYTLQTEAALVPHLLTYPKLIKGWHPIFEIEEFIKKQNWMPHLTQKPRSSDPDSFFAQPLTDQMQAVLLYAMTQMNQNRFMQILSTPCLAEQKFEPSKTVRVFQDINLRDRN